MPIVGFIVGYYRTGTTIFARVLKNFLKQCLVLMEPTQHEIVLHIINEGCKKVHSLHGFAIFEDYCKLPFGKLLEFFNLHHSIFSRNPDLHAVITSFDKVKPLLDLLNSIKNPIVIKSNQIWLFLKKLIDHYNCWVVILDREIEHIVADHLDYDSAVNRKKIESICLRGSPPFSFYCDLIFDNLTKLFKVDISQFNTPISRLLFNLLVFKKSIEIHSKLSNRITVVNFDKFILNPYRYLNKLPFSFDTSVEDFLDARKINPVNDYLRDLISLTLRKLKIDFKNIESKIKQLNNI